MNKILNCTIFSLLMLGLSGCDSFETPTHAKAMEEAEMHPYDAIAHSIIYIKDDRVDNLCFGYMWGGMASGGPAMATVDCAKVEKLIQH